MSKFSFKPTLTTTEVITARLGSGTGSANALTDADKSKFVKLAGSSRYNLAAVGDEIEGQLSSVNTASQDGYAIGGVAEEFDFVEVTFDGAQATPGTGTIAIGDYVLVGTVVVKGTPLSGPPRVVKATDQAAAKNSPFACRVEDLGSVGTGAVNTTGIIRQVA